jgi:glycosyltransferase involved in cell wall biosynthesis
MSALRILHVVPYYDQAWAYGGIPRLAAAMTRALARSGHQVVVCTTDARDDRSRADRGRCAPDGVDVRMFRNVSNTLAYHLQIFTPVGFRAFVRDTAASFDIAHIHACHNFPGVIAARALARAGVPYIVQPNGTARPIERRVAAKRLFARTFARRFLADAARIIAVSEAERRQLRNLGVDGGRIALVANPVDLSEFATVPDPREFRHQLGIGGEPLVLFLGKLTPRKGVDDLVRAMAHVTTPHTVLTIAGNDMGTGAHAAGLAKRLGLDHRVLFVGGLEGPARLTALTAADLVVYPSRDEIFGLVPLEALLCGTPVVVCDDSGCGEIISSLGATRRLQRVAGALGFAAIVPHGDVPALASAIDVMLHDSRRRRDSAATAAESIRRLYDSDVIGSQLEALYEDVTAEKHLVRAAPDVGVSFVMPVLNGGRTLRHAIDAILAERDGRPFELIAVDDGSSDGSLRRLEQLQARGQLTLLRGTGLGAAAAINVGILAACHPIVCQIDQDVVLQPGWLPEVLAAFSDPDVAAAQGHYFTKHGAGFWARATGRDLEYRYSRIVGDHVDHVCTGNTAYRASALRQAGLLDEQLGYGYDNDLSYRLTAMGYRLAFRRRATSIHLWREGFGGYMRQQFGVGYGRLDVVARHPVRVTGDDVSNALMMAHGPVMLAALGSLATCAVLAAAGLPSRVPGMTAVLLIAFLTVERICAGAVAWRRTGDPAALGFAAAHLARDVSWAYAIALWLLRRLLRRVALPSHSMRRADDERRDPQHVERPHKGELLVVVPAFNEAASLSRVIDDVARVVPREDILVVNDGSTDDTERLLPTLGVRWLSLSQRLGVGGAVRAGIRYAHRHGYRHAVRVDGDGQHRACDIPRLLAVVSSNRADAAIGSRFLRRRRMGVRGITQAMLAACLTVVSGRRVTDPTSGFWLFGPRALRLLSGHHPAGYAEPELVLFLRRNKMQLVEVPIRTRPRRAGRTSLTAPRAAVAFARTLLAIVIVPLRQLAEGSARD